MRIKCLGCEVLARPIYQSAALSPHIVDVELLPRGLHVKSSELHDSLQAHIDAVDSGSYDAVVLVYGLCGQAIAGLAARSIPLVIPKAHDCITLFLGSRKRYQDEFIEHPGTYWYTLDYLERDDGSGSTLAMGSGGEDDLQAVYQTYVEKYGEDNADYLMDVMGAWRQHYNRAVYIDTKVGDGSGSEAQAREQADRRGWTFERMEGDLILVHRLLMGDWQADTLVVPPGQQITPTYDDEIIRCLLAE